MAVGKTNEGSEFPANPYEDRKRKGHKVRSFLLAFDPDVEVYVTCRLGITGTIAAVGAGPQGSAMRSNGAALTSMERRGDSLDNQGGESGHGEVGCA